MKKFSKEWEYVNSDTTRLRVNGGWLVRTTTNSCIDERDFGSVSTSVALCFIADNCDSWILKDD